MNEDVREKEIVFFKIFDSGACSGATGVTAGITNDKMRYALDSGGLVRLNDELKSFYRRFWHNPEEMWSGCVDDPAAYVEEFFQNTEFLVLIEGEE